jgi:hypothetical protein
MVQIATECVVIVMALMHVTSSTEVVYTDVSRDTQEERATKVFEQF